MNLKHFFRDKTRSSRLYWKYRHTRDNLGQAFKSLGRVSASDYRFSQYMAQFDYESSPANPHYNLLNYAADIVGGFWYFASGAHWADYVDPGPNEGCSEWA